MLDAADERPAEDEWVFWVDHMGKGRGGTVAESKLLSTNYQSSSNVM